MNAFDAAVRGVTPIDAAAARQATTLQDRLTKPAGSLGRLEALGIQLAAIAGACPPPVPARPAVVVFAGDHGVLAEGVTPWPQEVTAQMVANFLSGGAAINVVAREVGATVTVVDIGVATPIPPVAEPEGGRDGTSGRLVRQNVRAGTGNLAVEPAMSAAEAVAALAAGAGVAADLVDEGADCLVTGEMGIGNTTPSAALIAAIAGRPPRDITGRGTGIGDAMWETKVAVIERALGRATAGLERTAGAERATAGPERTAGADTGSSLLATTDPLTLLAEIGGLEIGGLAGFIIGGAAAGLPVVLDGVVTLAAALVATALVPAVAGYLVAGHRSTEPGAPAALEHLGLAPLLDLGLRLGEGTGGCLAVPLVRAASSILSGMATFGDAGVASIDG